MSVSDCYLGKLMVNVYWSTVLMRRKTKEFAADYVVTIVNELFVYASFTDREDGLVKIDDHGPLTRGHARHHYTRSRA